MPVFVGVDAAGKGWVAVGFGDGDPPRAWSVTELAELSAVVPDARGFGVDIPIGLPTAGTRAADVAAREFLGPRRNSVFATPVREALVAPTHAEATAISVELTGRGVSQQAYALRSKILQADRWVQEAGVPVWEVHPEVSFTVLMGHPARAPKRMWAGMKERLDALRGAGIELDDLGRAGELAGTDDVLDAAVAAWSAERLVRGRGLCLPDPPEHDPVTGRDVAIWA